MGSSVGAVLACQLGSGRSIDELYAARTAPPGPTPESPVADLQYFLDTLPMWGPAREDVTARIELGKRALATPQPINPPE